MSESETTTTSTARVITGKLHRVRNRQVKKFIEAPPATAPGPVRRPARVAVMLALAHKIEATIQGGTVRDRADAARRLELTRSRVTQLLDLTLLAPDLQAAILELESVDGVEPVAEHTLRRVVRAGGWVCQRERWTALASGFPAPVT